MTGRGVDSNDATRRLELAITELRGAMDAALARIEGRLELLVQRAEQSDQRVAEQSDELRRHDERLDRLERDAVTRADMDRRMSRTVQVLGVIATMLGIAAGAGTNIVIAIIG